MWQPFTSLALALGKSIAETAEVFDNYFMSTSTSNSPSTLSAIQDTSPPQMPILIPSPANATATTSPRKHQPQYMEDESAPGLHFSLGELDAAIYKLR